MSITLDLKLDYISKVDLEIRDVSFLTEWDKNLLLFTKTGLMHVLEHEKSKRVLQVDLREKIDFFSMEQYGTISNQIQNADFEV